MPKESAKSTITSYTGTPLVRVVDGLLSRNISPANLVAEAGAQTVLDGRYTPIGNEGARAFVHQMDSGVESAVALCLGDSTSDAADEVFAEFVDWVGETWPAYSTVYRLWNDTNQNYDRRSIRSVGTDGLPYVELDGTGDWINCPDTAGISITGDQYGIVIHRADDWTPGATYTLMMKDGGGGKRTIRFLLSAISQLTVQVSTDGTNYLTAVTSDAVIPGLVDGVTDMALGFTLDADNGAGGHDIKFWYATYDSATGAIGTWTQLGSTRTTAGTVTLADHNGPLQVGANSAGTEASSGRIYYAEYGAGVDLAGNPRASMDPSTWVLGTTFKDGEGNTWTLQNDATVTGGPAVVALNGSVAGEAATYATDATRQPKLVPTEPAFTLINYGHNYASGSSVQASYTDLIDDLLTLYPYSTIICTTQTPKSPDTFTAVQVRSQAIRMSEILRIAEAKGVMAIDPFKEMNAAADVDIYLVDGIHPNATGTALWLAHLKRPFQVWRNF